MGKSPKDSGKQLQPHKFPFDQVWAREAVHSVESRKGERLDAAAEEYYAFANEFPESKYMAEAKSIFEKTKKKDVSVMAKTEKKAVKDSIQNAKK